jgi:hypothetical protein
MLVSASSAISIVTGVTAVTSRSATGRRAAFLRAMFRRAGACVSKSAASRHFVALSAARMKEWMGADLPALDIMVVQIDGIHISEHLVLVAALGIDSQGFKHPLI